MSKQQLEQKQQLANQWIAQLAPAGRGGHEEIFKAANYSLQGGGKRLRPVLTMAACEAAGGTVQQAKHFAVGVECVHTYSLIHDDLPCMDNDALRRGKPTNHVVFGEAMALLAGDALLNYAFELLAGADLPPDRVVRGLQCLSQASGAHGMIGGQVMDIAGAANEQQLLAVHGMKTGALIAAAVQLGAAAAGAEQQMTRALTDYACHLGLAFQIQDDILNVIGQEDTLGKPIGSDAQSGKCTFVTLFGVEGAKEKRNEYTRLAKEALAPFGDDGAFLLWLAHDLAEREQ